MSWVNGAIGEWDAVDEIRTQFPNLPPIDVGQAEQLLTTVTAIRENPILSELLRSDVNLSICDGRVTLITYPLMKLRVNDLIKQMQLQGSVAVLEE